MNVPLCCICFLGWLLGLTKDFDLYLISLLHLLIAFEAVLSRAWSLWGRSLETSHASWLSQWVFYGVESTGRWGFVGLSSAKSRVRGEGKEHTAQLSP